MATYKITGELNGQSKTVNVDAADRVAAINKIKAEYPGFEFAHEIDEHAEPAASKKQQLQGQGNFIAGNQQSIELPGTVASYSDVSAPTLAELRADAESQGGGVGSFIRLGKLYHLNDSGIPTVIDNCLQPTSDPTANAAILQAAVKGPFTERTSVCISGTWEINERIQILNPVDIRGGRFTRIDESMATTTTSIAAVAGSFTVDVNAVPSHWQVGTRLVIRDPTIGTTNGIGPNSHINIGINGAGNTTLRIDGIDGNTIRIGNGSEFAFAAGAELVQSIDFFFVTSQARFFDCIFDGNKANNPMETWLAHTAISVSAVVDNANDLHCEGCLFINGPGETIFGSKATVLRDCRWLENNGSLVHISTQLSGTDDIGEGVVIDRPYAHNCCLKSQSLDHSEAYITFSARSAFITLKDGHFRNDNRFTGTDVGACDVIGEISWTDGPQGDSQVVVENMSCKNFESIVRFTLGAGSLPDDLNRYGLKIRNSNFVSCGDIVSLSPANITGAGQFADVEIANNRMWGSRIHLRSCIDVKIRGNKFYQQGYQTGYYEPSEAVTANANGCIVHVHGDLVDVSTNQFFPHVDTTSKLPIMTTLSDATPIEYAVRVESEQVPGGSQLLEATEVRVTDNRIQGYRYGIHVGQNSTTSPSSDYQKNPIVARNTIIHHHNDGLNGDLGLGIVIKPGTICRDNIVVGISQMARGISINGGSNGNPAFDQRWTYVTGNIVRLNETPAVASIANAVGGNSEALMVINNITPTTISLSGTATNRVDSPNFVSSIEPDLALDWQFHVFDAPF